MSRRYLLVASSAASIGYVVGWLAGSNVQRMAEGRRLGRERRAAEAYLAGAGADPTPEQWAKAHQVQPVRRREPRTALPTPVESPEPRIGRETGAWRLGLGTEPLPTQRDDEPCPVTLGVLTCPFRGPHTSHAFQSQTWAPDRKDDTDEGIE